jgi:16S rRNA A1518/A1519 N6-dimethyltransferase RsmA/KsgA/DIM1 with predicted DNA glycosylase/AP lyase activity
LKDRLNQKDWESLNIDSGLRPEDLSIQDYASMSNYLKNE